MREIDIGIEPNAKFETQVAAAQLFDGDSDLLLCREVEVGVKILERFFGPIGS